MTEPAAAGGRGEHPQPVQVAGERKPVTAVFVDLVGSTALAESMDPEEWAEVVNGAFAELARPVARYEGTVAQLQGDAMVVLFGAPTAHEDDPERAVRAGLEMVNAIEAYRMRLAQSNDIDLRVRIGINTGPVVVGHVGTEQRLEYTAIGDTMNVAARMQTTADVDTVRLTAATQRLVRHAFETRDLGPVAVKGKREPVHAFEVIRERAVRASPRGLPGAGSPMIGRDAEISALREHFVAIGVGDGGGASITGEPGIGKTRLLREFRRQVVDESGGRWAQAQALSHGRSLPYHLVADLVRNLAGIDDADDAPSARRALATLIDERARSTVPVEAELPAAAYLAHVLSLAVDPAQLARIERLEPDALQARYAEALTAALDGAAERPLVVALEDVHWADESSVGTLARLLPMARARRLLLVVTSRATSDQPGARLLEAIRATYGERTLEIPLAGLTTPQSRELVARLLEIESLPAEVRDAILAKSDGNPFFVEEVIRMLVDRGAVVRHGDRWVAGEGIESVAIPPTLHGLLLARLDALPGAAKRAIRAASVIGRTFAVEILEQVVGPLDGVLPTLETAGLLTRETDGPVGSWAFRHALVQDAAYDSILRRERADLHRAVAAAIERSEPDRLDERAAELAHHLEAAGDLETAGEWAFRAARHAERHGAMPEARALYDRAATWLPNEPASARRRVEIALGQGRTGLYFQSFDDEIERLEQAVEEAEALGDRRLLVEVYTALAFGLQLRGEQYGSSDRLRAAIDRAVELGESLGDDPIRGRPLLSQAFARLMTGGYASAVDLLTLAIPLLEAGGGSGRSKRRTTSRGRSRGWGAWKRRTQRPGAPASWRTGAGAPRRRSMSRAPSPSSTRSASGSTTHSPPRERLPRRARISGSSCAQPSDTWWPVRSAFVAAMQRRPNAR